MKILFSPSEGKNPGGTHPPLAQPEKQNYLFPEHTSKRIEMIKGYRDYVLNASDGQLEKLFGTKKASVIEHYKGDLFDKPTMKVIERYSGVAFEYLAYSTLNKSQKGYVDSNTIIFSNLFGPLLAGNTGIPDYKLKQGQTFNNRHVEKFYRELLTDSLDTLLKDAPFLDLRAGFYTKFYKATTPHITLKFLKDGKTVSHWSKAYRGIVLREMAKQNVTSSDAFMKMKIPGLIAVDATTKGVARNLVYEVTQ